MKKGKAGEHLLSVEVISLQAQGVIPIPHYATTMACKDGEGDGFIPFAMNDRPGVYKIVVRDLLSGLFAESIVNLTAEKQG